MLLAMRSWLPISDSPPLWVTTSPLAESEWEAAYSQTLLATGASSYAVQAGALPPGLAIAGNTISGTPRPSPLAPTWSTAAGSLGVAAQGSGFTAALAATGAVGFVVRAGILPWGVTLNTATGVLAGTLAVIGGAEDSPGPAPTWTTPTGTLGTLWEGGAASLTLSATGAAEYTISGGILPWGLVLDRTTGVLTGTQPDMGGAALDPLETYTWSAPVSPNLGSYAIGAAVSIAQTPTSTPTPSSFYILTGGLPWGLTLNADTGAIGGTVSTRAVRGAYSLTIARIDTAGRFGSRAYTITIL
jgi:large repetitive protein